MLMALSASFSSETLFGSPFSTFDTGFTPWECPEYFFSTFKVPANGTKASGKSGSSSSAAASEERNRYGTIIDERKRRRMISNRESARRSRMRKQKHLENLRNMVNRFGMENRNLSTRLRFFQYHCNRIRTQNDQLQTEQMLLRQKLSEISELLVLQQLSSTSTCVWPCSVPQ